MTDRTYTEKQVEKLLATSKANIEQLKKEVEDLKDKVSALKEVNAKLAANEKFVKDTLKDITRREAELEPQEKALEDAKAAFKTEKAEVKALKIEVDAMLKTFAKNEESLKKDYEKLAAKEVDSHEAIKKEAEKLISDAKAKAKEIIEKAEPDTTAFEEQIKQLSEEKTKLSSKNSELVSENETLSNTLKNYIGTMNSFKTLERLLKENGKSAEDFIEEIAGMDAREQELNAKEDKLKELDQELKRNENKNQIKARMLEEKQSNIDEEVKQRYPEIIEDKEDKINELTKELKEQREKRASAEKILNAFKDIKADLGGKNPIAVLKELNAVKAELSTLRDDMNDPASYINKKSTDLREQERQLEERENALTIKERQSRQLKDSFAQIQAEKDELQQKNVILEKDKKILEDNLNRLRSTYENPAVRDERIKEINKPLIENDFSRLKKNVLKEIDWLNEINEKIEKSGLHFPRRILNAFHTALKTSEMSPLTVLAGVSGTGKSELPRLYSRFGGLNFLGVPVQPNWDCQEAMLGYYNSIDNCFEPTDMLRLLAQSQRDHDNQNGMNDVMTMILLDEMNLANVELYFAEFLSKLETRRGLADNEVPYLGVKIGSKMKDWELKLGRNVLWTGTMNNDETTKTLSDKVLDRGIVINFPRPDKLIRSRKNIVLAEPSALLPKIVWDSWGKGYEFTDDEIKGYQEKVEEINRQLGKTGRALGHRVWQSIENYMSLYPEVIAAQGDAERNRAMGKAFEDQLVQKVMPKLRGLENRGSQEEVLNAIKKIIPETLYEDFDNAMNQNYDQFIWTTSGYLLKEDKTEQNDGGEGQGGEKEVKPALPDNSSEAVDKIDSVSDNSSGALDEASVENVKPEIALAGRKVKLRPPIVDFNKHC